MPSTLWQAFCGGSYQALAPILAADQTVNLYTETREVAGSPKQVWMYGTPGLRWFAMVATQGGRGWFSQDGRTWTVVGNALYEVNYTTGTVTTRGTIANDGLSVSFATNGQGGDQLGIVGGGELKVLDLVTNVLSAAISLPFSNPVTIEFLDGYGLINEADTPIVWYSALEDLETWDALDFFTRSGSSDNIVGLAVTKDRVVTVGTKTTTQFYNSGDTDTPFLPYPGTTIQTGSHTARVLDTYNDQVYFLGQSDKGQHRVVRLVETQIQDISTPPINAWLARCPTLDDAEILMYEQAGHPFMAITAPSSPDEIKTYVWNIRESLWHARAGFSDGQYTRWRASGSAVDAGGRVFVGDFENGNLYTLDLTLYEDQTSETGTAILKAERTAPYASAENQWFFLQQVELGVQVGQGLSDDTVQGYDPQAMLEISRDGAQSWTPVGFASLGKLGAYLTRVIWRPRCRVRADRLVLRVTQTDPVQRAWGPGLWLRLETGTGQL